MVVSSREIASYLSTEHVGENIQIENVHSPEKASETDITYVSNKEILANSEAGAVITSPDLAEKFDGTVIVSSSPRDDFILVYDEYFREYPEETNIHPASVVESTAEIGENCIIGANSYIGENVTIGDNCVIYPGVVIGMDGFGYTRDEEEGLHRQVHKGGVTLEDDVTIGANSCIDSGIFESTLIKSGTKVDNLVHIAHACEIGEDCMITAGCCFGGSVTVGNTVYMHPHATVYTTTTIGEGAEIGMNSTVGDDVESYAKVVGTPARKVGHSRYHPQG